MLQPSSLPIYEKGVDFASLVCYIGKASLTKPLWGVNGGEGISEQGGEMSEEKLASLDELANAIDHEINELVSSLDFCHPDLRKFHINNRKQGILEACQEYARKESK